MSNQSPSHESRLHAVIQAIRNAEKQFGRAPGSVKLLAVSKTRHADEIGEMAHEGQRMYGENYLQEALDKITALQELALEWHFIGPIQSNKTRPIAEHFDWVHSVDRYKIAQRLSEQRPAKLPPLDICLQVNVSGEETKSGVPLDELPELAAKVASLPNLHLRGLMAIPAPCDDFTLARKPFRQLREALEMLQQNIPGLDTLSMGMSDDLEAAVAEGATIVRIGTALFGPRPAKKPS